MGDELPPSLLLVDFSVPRHRDLRDSELLCSTPLIWVLHAQTCCRKTRGLQGALRCQKALTLLGEPEPRLSFFALRAGCTVLLGCTTEGS